VLARSKIVQVKDRETAREMGEGEVFDDFDEERGCSLRGLSIRDRWTTYRIGVHFSAFRGWSSYTDVWLCIEIKGLQSSLGQLITDIMSVPSCILSPDESTVLES
jgi:hypothetical protein